MGFEFQADIAQSHCEMQKLLRKAKNAFGGPNIPIDQLGPIIALLKSDLTVLVTTILETKKETLDLDQLFESFERESGSLYVAKANRARASDASFNDRCKPHGWSPSRKCFKCHPELKPPACVECKEAKEKYIFHFEDNCPKRKARIAAAAKAGAPANGH